MEKRHQNFQSFWPFYLSQHQFQGTRSLHYAGTTALLTWLIFALIFKRWPFIFYGIISVYSLAWIGHFGIEKNKPATFQYPLYSLLGDFKMYGLACRGVLDQEYCRYKIDTF